MGIEKGKRSSYGRFLLFATGSGHMPEEIVEAFVRIDKVQKAFMEVKGGTALNS